MRKILLLVVLGSQLLHSQKTRNLYFSSEEVQLKNRNFYISDVVDLRTDNISDDNANFLGTEISILFENGLENAFYNYYENAIPKEKAQTGVVLKITQLHFSEKNKVEYRKAFVTVAIDYYYEDKLLFRNKQEVISLGKSMSTSHSKNLEAALNESLIAFSNSNWKEKVLDSEDLISKTFTPTTVQSTSSLTRMAKEENRDVLAIGYQIGGFTLIGFDYEYRYSDYAGIHIGAGVQGATAGIKIHTTPSKNSPFLNFNFKDGGFGLLSTFGVDVGFRAVLNKRNDMALHVQLIFAHINKIDEETKKELFGYGETPKGIISFGAGFSW